MAPIRAKMFGVYILLAVYIRENKKRQQVLLKAEGLLLQHGERWRDGWRYLPYQSPGLDWVNANLMTSQISVMAEGRKPARVCTY